jgi:hypothetical protein
MDFITVLQKVTAWFDEHKVPYAVIGGFALGLYGVVRGTNDLDFMIDRGHVPALKKFLAGLSYQVDVETENVIQFSNPLDAFGSLDFLISFRAPSQAILKRARKHTVLNKAVTLNVVQPEDLIGLKVQAMCNDESRAAFDMRDIEELLAGIAQDCDWALIKSHFVLFDKLNMYEQLRARYAK